MPISILKQTLSKAYRALSAARTTDQFETLLASGLATRGRHSYGIPTVRTFPGNDSRLAIGSFVSIADEVTILLGGNHPASWVSTFPLRIRLGLPGALEDGMPSSKGDVVIGSDVWICQRSTILSGASIGHGAIVTAGSLVAGKVPPYAIMGGVPARLIRYRFEKTTIDSLLAIEWWNWPEARITEAVSLLSSPNVDEFLKYCAATRR